MQRAKVLLSILIAVGAALTVSWQFQLWEHRSELQRLSQQLGRFEINDPSLTHLRRLPPPAANICAWRCYFPERDGLTKLYVYCDAQLIYDEVHEVGWLPVEYAFLEKRTSRFEQFSRASTNHSKYGAAFGNRRDRTHWILRED